MVQDNSHQSKYRNKNIPFCNLKIIRKNENSMDKKRLTRRQEKMRIVKMLVVTSQETYIWDWTSFFFQDKFFWTCTMCLIFWFDFCSSTSTMTIPKTYQQHTTNSDHNVHKMHLNANNGQNPKYKTSRHRTFTAKTDDGYGDRGQRTQKNAYSWLTSELNSVVEMWKPSARPTQTADWQQANDFQKARYKILNVTCRICEYNCMNGLASD